MKKINVKYDGKYPNFCRGKLIVTINGKIWEFPDNCINKDLDIEDFPKNFPEKLKQQVQDAVDDSIIWMHCGGCD